MKGNVADIQFAHYIRARDNGHKKWLDEAKKFDRFYGGDQWDESDLSKLRKDGRPALTFNKILSTVNAALGEHASRAMELTFKPKRNASREVSRTLSQLANQILHDNRYEFVENSVVADGLIMDRGFFDIRIDFSDHLQGEVKITSVDPRTVLLDPDAKEYDPSTWNEVMTTKWLTPDDIANIYGQAKMDKLHTRVKAGQFHTYDSVKFEEERFGDTDPANTPSVDLEDRQIRSIRVIERQYYRWQKQQYFVDPATGDMKEVPEGWDDEKVAMFAEQNQLTLHEKPNRKVRWTVTADDVVLFDEWSLYDAFTIVPYFPYFRRGRAFGMVRNLVSPQEALNKARSQTLHIVNTTANSGWTAEEGTLVNMTEDELEQRGAETGLVLIHARGSNPPQKIQPNSVPTGLTNIANETEYSIQAISGINDGALGMTSGQVSGKLMDRKTERAQMQLQQPFKNLSLTRRILGERLLKLIQNFYTEERVIQITHDDDPEKDAEELYINTVDAAGGIVNDVTRGRYDVSITTRVAVDNQDEAEFQHMIEMRQSGVMMPDDIIMRHSPLRNRDDIAERIREMQGTAEPSEEEIEMMMMQQQLAIETAQAELQKLMAEAEEVATRSALNMAKAEKEAGGANAPDMEFKRDQLEAQIQMKREELMTRIKLAELTHQNKARSEHLRTLSDLTRTKYQAETQLQSAAMASQRNAGGKD